MRLLRILVSYKQQDSVKSLVSDLNLENGSPAVFMPKIDTNAIDKLRELDKLVNGRV